MSFVVTARKYRPQQFSEVIGQEHITETLKNALITGRIAHAYLMTGPRGVGKTTTARILAKALNCMNLKDGEPCNLCEVCQSIQNGQLMDIIEMDAASNRGIDEIRSLRESVKYSPTQGKYKVYIIDEVHMLTRESFNAFLKTLEEPPSHTVFIFATTDVHKVPSTIISRCQRYDFRRIPLSDAKKLLKEIATKEAINIDDKTLTMIAKKSLGGMRDAESFFDQAVAFCGNKIDYETTRRIFNMIDDAVYFRVSDALLEKNFQEAFELSKTIYLNGWDFPDFIDGLIEHFRNITSVVVTNDTELIEAADDYLKIYSIYKEKFCESDLLRILAYLTKFSNELKYSQNQKLRTEVALLHIIGLEKTESISNLINNLSGSGSEELNLGTKKGEDIQILSSGKSASSKINANTAKADLPVKPVLKSQNEARIILDQSVSKPGSTVITPSTNHNISIQLFKDNWSGFISSLSGDATTVFSHLLESMKPVSLNSNFVQVEIPDELGKGLFEKNKNLLTQKCFEYFGHKLNFNCIVKEEPNDTSMTVNLVDKEQKSKTVDEKTVKVKSKKNSASKDDPFVKSIMDDLGGEEIYS